MPDQNYDMNKEQLEEFGKIYKEFEQEALAHQGEDATQWMAEALCKRLPDMPKEDADAFVRDALKSQQVTREKKESLSKAMSQGRDKYNWFASVID